MKELNRILFAATVALGLAAAAPVMAQSQLSGPEGTAMSPKTRFLLAQSQAPAIILTAQPAPVWPSGVNTTGMAGMPKQQQMQAQTQTAQPTATPNVTEPNRPMGANGLAISPKQQQMRQENTPEFQIAPLK